jgi:S-adenosyl methyltransferase
MHRPPAHNPAPPMNTATIRGARTDQQRLSGDHHHEHAQTSGVMTCPNARTRSTLSKIAGVLHFLPGTDDPQGIVKSLTGGLAPGSFVVVSHLTGDFAPGQVASGVAAYNSLVSAGITARSHAEVTALFGDLSLVPPGVVPVSEWRPDLQGPDQAADMYAGLATIQRRPW